MIKDPNHETETAYELLALTPNAPIGDVQKALTRFIKGNPKNRPRIGEAQEAVQKLQKAKSRAGIDIWLYDLDTSQVDLGSHREDQLDLSEFQDIPAYSPDLLYCDLDGSAMQKDFREITVIAVKFSDVKAFDGLDEIKLRPRLEQ